MEHTQDQPTAPEPASAADTSAYEAPAVTPVGSFAADTLGDVSNGQSDDSDAGQYYAP